MQGFGDIRQVAYLCTDIEKTMRSWIDKAELGPFIWYTNLTLPMNYRGEASDVGMEVGLAFRGNLQIELIQQTNAAPSPYKAFFDEGRMGLHHIAFGTSDMDASLAQARARGYDIIATIDSGLGRYAYFQDPVMPEVFYEFLGISTDGEAHWRDGVSEAAQWDGRNPIRVVDMSGM